MQPSFFDSNIYLRLAQKASPQRQIVLEAVRKLRVNNEVIYYTPQVLAEFWNVCTRPETARGGLELSIEQTERKVNLLEKHFKLLPDNLATFNVWRRLVFDYKIFQYSRSWQLSFSHGFHNEYRGSARS